MSVDILSIDYQSKNCAKLLEKSLKETGFAVITNHPISHRLIQDVYFEWKSFFSAKLKHNYIFNSKKQDGFFPYLTENAKGSKNKDLKEFFHYYPWGQFPDSMSNQTKILYDQLVDLGSDILSSIEENFPKTVKENLHSSMKNMIHNSKNHLFRILHYPPVPKDSNLDSIRAHQHEDINLITLLVAGSEPGLEVLGNDLKWYQVDSNENNIVVNSGDMLKLATNNYYPSTTHRVVNPSENENVSRYSMPLFIHPNSDAMLDKNTRADQFLNNRLREIGLKE